MLHLEKNKDAHRSFMKKREKIVPSVVREVLHYSTDLKDDRHFFRPGPPREFKTCLSIHRRPLPAPKMKKFHTSIIINGVECDFTQKINRRCSVRMYDDTLYRFQIRPETNVLQLTKKIAYYMAIDQFSSKFQGQIHHNFSITTKNETLDSSKSNTKIFDVIKRCPGECWEGHEVFH